jgi:ribonuclease E
MQGAFDRGEQDGAPGQEPHAQEAYAHEAHAQESHAYGHEDDTAQSGDHGEQSVAPTGELTGPPAAEPALKDAVADLDVAPAARAPAPDAMRGPSHPAASAVPAAEPEPARRRSTVRERAPVSTGEDMPASAPASAQPVSPAPEPVVTDGGEAADSERPRKTGWWSRRFAGG